MVSSPLRAPSNRPRPPVPVTLRGRRCLENIVLIGDSSYDDTQAAMQKRSRYGNAWPIFT